MTLKECPDRTILALWRDPTNNPNYQSIQTSLYNWGYDCTAHEVRRRIKKILHQRRLIPRRPTLDDYRKSRLVPGRHADDLN